ncbi:hypothetical protein [Sphingobium sp. Z007]|uniref:hypothetical protein n=1 Tax=Sphingobium sp. Z007 TaxID=627495 RepID=UPI000B4A4A75|nr:hypothetical protein [Sphingobium sp. Z007]
MGKFVRTAALVVGAAALVATGIGAAAGAGLIGASITTAAGATVAGFAGVAASTFTAVGAIAGVAASLASLAAGPVKPKTSLGGNATKFTIDKESGVPYAIGRTYSAGRVIHRQYYGSKQEFESWVAVHSLGPIRGYQTFEIENAPVTFSGGEATGTYHGFMWLQEQRGLCPEAIALPGPLMTFPGWDANSKLSGLAADLWTLRWDSKGKKFPNGVPKRGRVLEGVLVYDPRQDSSYPGGSGPCRIDDESSWVYDGPDPGGIPAGENPALHALSWAYGRIQNGQLVAGGGLALEGIFLPPFVDWANVCDANKWRAGGIVFTTADDKWDVLKMIAQAGGGEVMPVGALLGCTFSAPRVSIGTITSDDIVGECDVPATVARRDRINAIIPKIRLETHDWETVPIDVVRIDDYVTFDGKRRTREVPYPLVQQADQAAELAAYDILNARELDPITLPGKFYLIDYLPGDCLTADIPEANLIDRPVLLRNRDIGMDGTITLACRTETAGKHDFALGRTGTPPPTPDLSIPGSDIVPPDAGAWSLVATAIGTATSFIPALVVEGAVDNPNAEAVLFEHRLYVPGQAENAGWVGNAVEPPTVTRKQIVNVMQASEYEVSISYRVGGVIGDRLILGPVTTADLQVEHLADDTVSTEKVVDNAITDTLGAANGSTITCTGIGNYLEVVAFDLTMALAGRIMLDATMAITFASGQSWAYRLILSIGGTDLPVSSGSGNVDHHVPATGFLDIAAGTYEARLEVAGTSGVSINGGAATLRALRAYK